MAIHSSEVLFLRPTSGLTKYFGTWSSLFAIVGASLGTWQWLFVGTLQDLYPGINGGDNLGDRVTLHVDLHGDDDVVVDGYATFRRHLPDLS